MKLSTLMALVLVAAAGLATAQSITFTGDVQNDFPSANRFRDPGGMDVGVPVQIAGNVSGWDMSQVALAYDPATDTLYLGLDTFGIGGDADGDGDPSVTSAGLLAAGGTDVANLGNTESFTFALDLDDDSALDVIAGIPFGSDITGYTVSNFSGSIFSPSFAFGAPLPVHTGTVFSNPTAMAPDLEFTVINFAALILQYAQPGQTHIQIHAFMGSFEDAGVGEDFFPGLATLRIPITTFPCFPIANDLTLKSVAPGQNGTSLTFSYGLLQGYSCCTIASLFFNPGAFTVFAAPNMPTIDVGIPGDVTSLIISDPGLPTVPQTAAVVCKEVSGNVPAQVPPGLVFYVQFYSYPINGMGNHFSSNVVSYTHQGVPPMP